MEKSNIKSGQKALDNIVLGEKKETVPSSKLKLGHSAVLALLVGGNGIVQSSGICRRVTTTSPERCGTTRGGVREAQRVVRVVEPHLGFGLRWRIRGSWLIIVCWLGAIPVDATIGRWCCGRGVATFSHQQPSDETADDGKDYDTAYDTSSDSTGVGFMSKTSSRGIAWAVSVCITSASSRR